MTDLQGKTAIVTGGGGGIGRATCVELSRAGANVVVVDLNTDLAAETVELVRSSGAEAVSISADVTKATSTRQYIDLAIETYGGLDILINSAGYEGVIHPVADYPEDVFDRVMAINVKGVFLALQHALPIMLRQKSGVIVNVASRAGLSGSANMGPYTGSKHAVVGLTKAAAVEVADQGIRINAVCPGPINTRMMRSIETGLSPHDPAAAIKLRESRIPQGRYGEPSEVAHLIVFLASDLASHITGQSIAIDGGSLAG